MKIFYTLILSGMSRFPQLPSVFLSDFPSLPHSFGYFTGGDDERGKEEGKRMRETW